MITGDSSRLISSVIVINGLYGMELMVYKYCSTEWYSESDHHWHLKNSNRY